MERVSSRTPEGQPNRCPICGASVRLEASATFGDAPCPQCGSLLWFIVTPHYDFIFPADIPPEGKEQVLEIVAGQMGMPVEEFVEDPPSPHVVRAALAKEYTGHVAADFHIGETVTIVTGPLKNHEAVVEEIQTEEDLVRVTVTIFGRQAPVECEAGQLDKL